MTTLVVAVVVGDAETTRKMKGAAVDAVVAAIAVVVVAAAVAEEVHPLLHRIRILAQTPTQDGGVDLIVADGAGHREIVSRRAPVSKRSTLTSSQRWQH